jgi:dolichyl-phosphate-mannose--protein O-mannosyl transferase
LLAQKSGDHVAAFQAQIARAWPEQHPVLVIAAFIFFYPIYSYYPLTEFQQDLRLWFPSWRYLSRHVMPRATGRV